MQLKRLTPFVVLGMSLLWSSHMSGLKFVPIYEALTIKAQKNSPPHIAFEEILASEQSRSEWAQFENIKSEPLAAVKNSTTPLYVKRVELQEMVLTKSVEVLAQASEEFKTNTEPVQTVQEVASSREWINQLPRTQAYRVEEAQRRSEVLDQKWNDVPTWSDMAKQVLDKAQAVAANGSGRVHVSSQDSSGRNLTLPQSEVRLPTNRESDAVGFMGGADGKPRVQTIVGPLEITGGLAVTNEHHIEIRRNDEGIQKELGKVDLRQGIYNINVEDISGTVVARLVNKEGKILGEGSFRMSRLAPEKTASIAGPKIKIEPRPDFAAVASSAYSPGVSNVAPANTRVTFIKGASEVIAKRDGIVAMDNVMKGSSTVLRAAAPNHMQTASIIISGKEAKTQLYPESMIAALQDIVAQQRAMSFEGAPTVIWGKVSLDTKSLSGIEVSVESDTSLDPIYFNDFMIPDPNLKATSENGLYAFVGVTPGFHSLLATRSDSILGYQNVIVEDGSVAQGDIEGTMKFETVPLRVYDAFTGEARPAVATLQSLSKDVEALSGVATIELPQLSRLGMMRIKPEGADYVPARYLYNDNDSFVHVPLIQWSWLGAIKSYLRIDDAPTAGVIVGFVPDENFEVYLAGYDNFEPRHIVYFDMQGRILQNRKGMAGGGFILYNVPEDVHEVVVLGSRTQKIYSRVLPVDANSLSVLNFRE